MNFIIVMAATILYICCAYMHINYVHKVKNSFFLLSTDDTADDFLMFMLWPIDIFIFRRVYSAEIDAVKQGLDWADLNIDDNVYRDYFKQEQKRKHCTP